METGKISSIIRSTEKNTESAFSLTSFKGIFEYLLILGPEGNLRERIAKEKDDFGSNYNNKAATIGKPHITLANYIQSDVTEDKILKQLKIIGMEANKLKIVLNNYQWFKQHTIYIDVKFQIDTKQLVRKIKAKITSFMLMSKEIPPRFCSTPHLTLCKNLTIDQFEKSRLEYFDKTFSGEFVADKMILLKRPIGGIHKYKEAGLIDFYGPEICTTTEQGILF